MYAIIHWIISYLLSSFANGLDQQQLNTTNRNHTIDSLQRFNIQQDNWYCGRSTPFAERSVELVDDHCPNAAFELNHCCAIHDDCYTQKNEKDYCDKQFCDCNNKIGNSKLGSKNCTFMYNEIACMHVIHFGHIAYNNSEPVAIKSPAHIDEADDVYQQLEAHCPDRSRTFSSCSISYDECHHRGTPVIECRHNLKDCLKYDDNNLTLECAKAIRNVIHHIDNYEVVKNINHTRMIHQENGQVDHTPLFHIQLICLLWIMMLMMIIMCSDAANENDRLTAILPQTKA